jgi:DNA-binding response OmpR family regulator
LADILVVDDDATVRALMRYLLVAARHEVYEAQNGDEGLRMLAAFRFDLAVIDIVMPVHDGVEVVRTLRAIGDEVPILIITGRVAEVGDPLAAAIRQGANRAMQKPLRPTEFLRVVEEMRLSGPRYFS